MKNPVTRKEMAIKLGISTKTLSRRIKEYKLPISSGLLNHEEQKLIIKAFKNLKPND